MFHFGDYRGNQMFDIRMQISILEVGAIQNASMLPIKHLEDLIQLIFNHPGIRTSVFLLFDDCLFDTFCQLH